MVGREIIVAEKEEKKAENSNAFATDQYPIFYKTPATSNLNFNFVENQSVRRPKGMNEI